MSVAVTPGEHALLVDGKGELPAGDPARADES